MSHNSQWDSIELPDLNLPYNRILGELSEESRLVRGQNIYVTTGGKIARRPGFVAMTSGVFNLRVDRAWIYETLDTPPVVYLVVSALNPATGFWEIWHQRLNNSPGNFLQTGTYRDLNLSTAPHEAVPARGLLFVKGIPQSGSSEKLGTVILDGTGGTMTVKPWGALGPSTPAALANSAVTKITSGGGISSSAVSMTVGTVTGALPATPFVAQIDFEQVNVTVVAGPTWTITRAFNGTVAAAHGQNAIVVVRNWSAAAHIVTVNQFWGYSYGYKDINGHYTNRAPAQTNPDALPSQTGPFFNQLPQITFQGLADTTNFPTVVIYRTTDGGQTFYNLQEIPNAGAGSHVYTDNSFTSGSGTQDPVPDSQLNTASFAPSLTSNSPPPTVLAPKVTGTDAPAKNTPFAYFQGRIWYGIGNVLFFSAQEELTLGIPECAFPSGLTGNFFRFQYPIVNVKETSTELFVFTLQATYVITGTNLQTFADRPLFDNYGAPYGHPRAVVRFGDTVAFLTHDYRIAIINDDTVIQISDPLSTDLVDQLNVPAEFDLKYFADLDKEWLIVNGHVALNPTLSRQWVYDIKKSRLLSQAGFNATPKNFWFLPWTFPSTAMVSGRISESTSQRRLVMFNWDPVGLVGQFSRMDPVSLTATDYLTTGATNFNVDMVVNLMRVPAGNHVNAKRQPGIVPNVYSIRFDRTLFVNDDDPFFYYFKDDLWTDPIQVAIAEDPARRSQSKGYKTLEYPIDEVAQRVAFQLTKIQSGDLFELQTFAVIFEPDAGA